MKVKPIHHLGFRDYYDCNRAIGNGIRGIATRNWEYVTCKNCLRYKISGNSLK